LTQIANSESKERGYARALLDLLSGIRNYPEDLEDAGYRSLQEIRQDRIINNPTEHLAFISPNPVTEDFMMVSVKNVNVTRGSITLTNMLGYTALSQTFTATPFNSVDVNCGGLEAGMYIIRVMDGERTLYEGKVSLLKY
jgi:hypothetical protein